MQTLKLKIQMNKIAFILISVLLVFANTSNAQTAPLKYKDIFSTVINESEDKAYEMLSTYQKQDPYNANAYYQLGIIAQQWAKKYDPLTDYENLYYFTYHASLYYSLCKKYLDEKESKKNWQYYQQAKALEGAKKTGHEQIMRDVTEKASSIKGFEENINHIRKNYFAAVRNYNQSLALFTQIVEKNAKLKDIYLTANSDLANQIKTIGMNFDSTIFYFDIYKEAIAEFPIKNYKQDYKILPIETYRLEGLTKSNFLKNDINLWNFRTWSDDVISVIDNDISKLRFDIDEESKKIDSMINLVNLTKDYSANLDNYVLNKDLTYRIGRFDFQPLILDIFNYKISKLNLQISSKKPMNNPANVEKSRIELMKKLQFYNELVNQKILADKNIIALAAKISDFNILKYEAYITENYKGGKGLNNYIEKEPKQIEVFFNKSMGNLKYSVIKHNEKKYINNNIVSTNKGVISLAIPYDILNGTDERYYTSAISKNSNGDKYFCGYKNRIAKNTKAFVAMCDSLNKIKWIKEYDFTKKGKPKADNYACNLALTENGCVVIIHSRDTSNNSISIKNQMITFNRFGKAIIKNKTGPALVPRILIYDDINTKIIAAYKGKYLPIHSHITDSLIVEHADSAGNAMWSIPIAFNGNIVNIVRSNQKMLIVGNYTELIDVNTIKRLKNNETNAFLSIIDGKGNIEKTVTFDEDYAYYITNAVKLNSETINFLGLKTNEKNLEKAYSNKKNKLDYRLIDITGKSIYKY